MPVQYPVRFESDVPIRLRDGTITHADIFRPEINERMPALLQRTPYNKCAPGARNNSLEALRAAMRGYAVVIQDVRGCFASEGEFIPFVNERDDGYDSVEWVALQPWCNGKVGMYGASYTGITQWLTAKAKPPSLVCIAPGVTASDYHDGWTWQGGAFDLAFNTSWVLGSFIIGNWERLNRKLHLPSELYDKLIEANNDIKSVYSHLPLKEIPEFQKGMAPYFNEWLDHSEYDDFWRELSIEEAYANITIPAFNYGGWYDIFLGGTIRNYTGMKESGATGVARKGQRLLVGPWNHGGNFTFFSGDFNFGMRAAADFEDLQGKQLRFFDYWMKGIDDGISSEKPVRIFVMGKNAWRDEEEWPLKRSRMTDYYLHSKGKANSLNGNGELNTVMPGAEPPDVYAYNPIDPVPTRGGGLCCNMAAFPSGAFDQRQVENREDVLVYSTPVLDEAVEVTGPVTVTLFASTSARDTDFTAKLVDVYPCGYARNLADSIIRARYRTPKSHASLVEPGKIYEYKIDLTATSNVFMQGHRIRLEISSSNFPRFDRNTNTGRPIGTDKGFVSALQSIHHSSDYPSRVTLPIVPLSTTYAGTRNTPTSPCGS